MVRLYETGLHPFFKTSQHKTGVHPFYIGMYIHIFMCIYIYFSEGMFMYFYVGSDLSSFARRFRG